MMSAQTDWLGTRRRGRIESLHRSVVILPREQGVRSVGGTTVSVAWWHTCGIGMANNLSRSCKSSRRSSGYVYICI